MLDALTSTLVPAALERLTLAFNHVIGQEPQAVERLRPHAGKRFRLEFTDWPGPLPAPRDLAWAVTPAGRLEWLGTAATMASPLLPELTLRVAAGDPLALGLKALAGGRPDVTIEGDAALATDIDWLLQNLRWDAAADLERVFPAPVAAALHTAGRALLRGLHAAANAAASARERFRPGPR